MEIIHLLKATMYFKFSDHWHWDFLHFSLLSFSVRHIKAEVWQVLTDDSELEYKWYLSLNLDWHAALDFLAGAPLMFMQLSLFSPDQFTKVIKKTLFEGFVWFFFFSCLEHFCMSDMLKPHLFPYEIWLFNILYRFKASIHISSLASILLHPFYCSILHMYT